MSLKKQHGIREDENIGKILLLSFTDNEEEIINSVLSVLETGRIAHCSRDEIYSLKIQHGDLTILQDKREVFRGEQRIA